MISSPAVFLSIILMLSTVITIDRSFHLFHRLSSSPELNKEKEGLELESFKGSVLNNQAPTEVKRPEPQ